MRRHGVAGGFVLKYIFDGNFADGLAHGFDTVVIGLAYRPLAHVLFIFGIVQRTTDTGIFGHAFEHGFAYGFDVFFLLFALVFFNLLLDILLIFFIRLAGKHARRFKIFAVKLRFFLEFFQPVKLVFADVVGFVPGKIRSIVAVCFCLIVIMLADFAFRILFFPVF